MERIVVESSLIHAVGYDLRTRVLEIQFQHGDIYRYFDVEPETYEELLEAPSKGTYFNDYIRDAYQFSRQYR
jgi:hypothetical protein